ncbi:MAG: amino acid ABC transporter permease [Aquabacterium sp.]
MSPAARMQDKVTPAAWLMTALGLALLAWVGWHVVDWAVVHAVFRIDPDACRAMGHQGACWGVVAEKARPILLGYFPENEQRWGGLPLTLALFVSSLLLSVPLAIGLALARKASSPFLSWLATAFIELVRGVPLITLLFSAAYLLPALLPHDLALPLFWRALMALTLFSAVYMAEIVRGGLQTVAKEQSEAAEILGLSWWQTQRRVVLPQAIRAVLPALTGHAIGLLKDSSLVMVIGLHELTGGLSLSLGGDPIWRPYYLEAYLFVGAIYAALCLGLSGLGRAMERRWVPGVR